MESDPSTDNELRPGDPAVPEDGSRGKPADRSALIGLYFTLSDEQSTPWIGVILDRPEPGWYLLQRFDLASRTPIDLQLMPVEKLARGQLHYTWEGGRGQGILPFLSRTKTAGVSALDELRFVSPGKTGRNTKKLDWKAFVDTLNPGPVRELALRMTLMHESEHLAQCSVSPQNMVLCTERSLKRLGNQLSIFLGRKMRVTCRTWGAAEI